MDYGHSLFFCCNLQGLGIKYLFTLKFVIVRFVAPELQSLPGNLFTVHTGRLIHCGCHFYLS